MADGGTQFFSFVNDNNGGIGGVRATVANGENPPVHLPVIAGWSNGHRTPPAELENLVKHFQDHPDEVARLQDFTDRLQKQYRSHDSSSNSDRMDVQIKLAAHLEEEYELADGTTVSLADAWAAMAYYRMNK